METSKFNIYTKKVGAGHFEITVVNNETEVTKKYVETDMHLYDAFTEEEEGIFDTTPIEAMEIIIKRSGFKN